MEGERNEGLGWVVNSVSGSVVIGSVVQGRDITVQLPPKVPAGLNGWRAPEPEFVGRADVLADLLEFMAPTTGADASHSCSPDGSGSGGRARVALVTAAVAGLGGIGKTELAVQAAHVAAERGWFGGGVLPIDLHGYAPEPARLTAAQAVANLLRGLSVPDEMVPAAFDERVRMYRAVLAAYAELDTPVLVVLDNASPSIDLHHLLPGTGRAIVTSRHTLARLPARLLDLQVLTDPDAAELLARLLVSKRPDDTRAEDHPDAAAEVARACAGLPLAIQLVAALLATHPGMPLAAMAERLRDETTRLERIDDDRPGLRAAFNLSYQALTASQQRMFRLISVNPGPCISSTAAAATASLQPGKGGRLMERLAEAHLVEPGETFGWWRMHDLVRQYATALGIRHTKSDRRDQALHRLLSHYTTTTKAAVAHLDPTVTDPTARGFLSREQALGWLDTERPNLIAAAHTAAGTGHPNLAIALSLLLSRFLNYRRSFNDWITLAVLARDTAAATNDRRSERGALNSLGLALYEVRRFEEAITAHQQDIAISRGLGDRHGESGALNNLGVALVKVRRFEEAIAAHQQDMAICRDLGDRHSEGGALNNLGMALMEVRRFDEAITAHQNAAVIHRDLDDRQSEGGALNNLGIALQQVRRFEEAITAHHDAITIFRDLDDQHSEGGALNNLGAALRQMGRFEEAITAHHDAITIFRDLDDQHKEGHTLNTLGNALREVRRFEEAITAHHDAITIFRDLGDLHSEGQGLNNLGAALMEARRFDEAIAVHQNAATIFRNLGDRYREGGALNNLGLALMEVRRFEEAIEAGRSAVEIFTEMGEEYNEALAREAVKRTVNASKWRGRRWNRWWSRRLQKPGA